MPAAQEPLAREAVRRARRECERFRAERADLLWALLPAVGVAALSLARPERVPLWLHDLSLGASGALLLLAAGVSLWEWRWNRRRARAAAECPSPGDSTPGAVEIPEEAPGRLLAHDHVRLVADARPRRR